MSRLDKGLLFFFDWEECFESLPDKDFKEIFLAMLKYKKYGTPPPEFTGSTKIAASLIFPQIDRQIKAFESGKKGGRPKKEDASSDIDNTINKEEPTSLKADSYTEEWDELINAANKKSARLKSEREERAKRRANF